MANYFNIFAGIVTFLGASAIAYGLWTPVMEWLDYFPTALYVLAGSLWVTLLFLGIVYAPFIMMVADDKGE